MSKVDQLLRVRLEKAAQIVARDIDKHFKRDKWPLHWGFLVDDVLFNALGLNAENFLLDELRKRDKYELGIKEDTNNLVIDLIKKRNKKQKTVITLKNLQKAKKKSNK